MSNRGPAPSISTERLILRGWRPEDRAAFAVMNADPRVSAHLLGPISPEDSDEMVDRILSCWSRRGYGLWAAERRDTKGFIGYVGLWPATFDAHFTPAVEVGWRLAPGHWGHGFATEGARAALRYAFDDLGLDEVVSFTAVVNARSVRVMERLGMQREHGGDFDHPVMPVDHPARRHVLYRLMRSDWARGSAEPA